MKLHGSLDNYIAMHRDRHGLSQRDLSRLISVEQRGVMASIETGLRRPNLINMIGLELVFGSPTSEIFRGVSERIAEEVRRNARGLLEELGDVSTPEAMAKVELLSALAHPDEVQFIPVCNTE